MSYREENGQVVLTMSREDYEVLLKIADVGIGWADDAGIDGPYKFALVFDRLNEGNPSYTPYQVENHDEKIKNR